jgi:hypothetical protein
MEENIEIINGRRALNKHVAAIQCSGQLSLVEPNQFKFLTRRVFIHRGWITFEKIVLLKT